MSCTHIEFPTIPNFHQEREYGRFLPSQIRALVEDHLIKEHQAVIQNVVRLSIASKSISIQQMISFAANLAPIEEPVKTK